jgi:altronate hydrolase
MKRGVIMNKLDNVATVLDDVEKDDIVECKGLSEIVQMKARENTPRGHKIALSDISSGAAVVKYGFEIGYALCDIGKGSYVHVHNVGSKRTEE